MNIKWNAHYNPDIVIEQINKVRKSLDGGGVTYSDGDFEGWTSLLTSMINLPSDISPSDKRSIISQALTSNDLSTRFSKKQLEEVINDKKADFWKNPIKTYNVVFEFPQFIDIGRTSMTFGKTKIYFSRSFNTSFFKTLLRERQQLKKQYARNLKFEPKSIRKSQIIIATVTARSPREAQETASNDFQVILGLINFLKNQPKLSRFGSGSPQPINDFVYLPFTTVHDVGGKLTFTGYWYQDWAPSSSLTDDGLKKLGEMIGRELPKLLKCIDRLPWKSTAKETLARYYQAFSEPNLEVSFLEAWRTLENFGGCKNSSYEKLVKRCSNMFKSRSLNREIGYHLTERRNSITHGNLYDGSDKEVVAYQLMKLMHPLLRIYLVNPFKLKRIEDFWAFADLEMDVSHLKHEIRIRDHALTFIT